MSGIAGHVNVPRGTDLLDRYAALVLEENERQNLVAASTVEDFASRHLLDSSQLVSFMKGSSLVDIGSGAGLPGLVLACATSLDVHLVEPRTKRASFLQNAARELGLAERVRVHDCKVERVAVDPVDTITARAVASIDRLFEMALHLSHPGTRWVLPKGRNAIDDLEEARQSWQGEFHLIASTTDPDASIVVAEKVRRRR